MAKQKKSFPMLPVEHWWALRKEFKQSIPGVVTDKYLATALGIKVDSVRADVLPSLEALGIIDDEGKTTERAQLWKDDVGYAEACQEMAEEVYPEGLSDAVSDPNQERSQAERWFAKQTGAGKAAVRNMAALYALLVEADASKQPDQGKKSPARKVGKERSKPARKKTAAAAAGDTSLPMPAPSSNGGIPVAPGINISFAIQISADASSDQIDQIFAIMAKHLYRHG